MFGIVDWGSQSIAQSKFQRAFRLGKEFQQEFFRKLRQHIFQKFLFGLVAEAFLHRPWASLLPTFLRPNESKGRGTCLLPREVQVLFQSIPCLRFYILLIKILGIFHLLRSQLDAGGWSGRFPPRLVAQPHVRLLYHNLGYMKDAPAGSTCKFSSSRGGSALGGGEFSPPFGLG